MIAIAAHNIVYPASRDPNIEFENRNFKEKPLHTALSNEASRRVAQTVTCDK